MNKTFNCVDSSIQFLYDPDFYFDSNFSLEFFGKIKKGKQVNIRLNNL